MSTCPNHSCELRTESLPGPPRCTTQRKNSDRRVRVKLREGSSPPTHLAGKETPSQNRPCGGTVRVVLVERAVRDENTTRQFESKHEDTTENGSRRLTYAYSFSGRSRWNMLGWRTWTSSDTDSTSLTYGALTGAYTGRRPVVSGSIWWRHL